MKNLHLLPTDKPSRIYLIKSNNKLGITSDNPFYTKNMGSGTQNQHIYIINSEEIKEGQSYIKDGFSGKNKFKWHKSQVELYPNIKKDIIILTTDQDLIKEGVQAIDNEFLEWFVKNSSCEEVEVELFPNFSNKLYGIIIPKEEPKQETLEEAAEKATFNPSLSWESEFAKEKFIEGAKWQQKRSYSEDEVLQLLRESHFVEQNIEEWFNQNKK